MTTIVLLGGNGYIGRHVTQEWLKRDKTAQFYVLSRSGKNSLTDSRIHNLKVDVSDDVAVRQVLPEEVDYIVDFVGRPESDPEKFAAINDKPAEVMLKMAKAKNVTAMGFIGGVFGPKKFVQGKQAIIQKLKASGIRTEVVEPTVVYGDDRQDTIAKMVPLLKVMGIFSKKMKPVHVDAVARELVSRLVG